MPIETLSVDQARRIALAAQGFGRPRTADRSNWRGIGRAVDTMGVLVCATETKTDADIDAYVAAMRDVLNTQSLRSA